MASIERVGLLLGWLVFLIPVVILVVIWLPARIRFFLRARAAQQFLDSEADLDLFALRAMVVQPMHVIAKISDGPGGGLAARRPARSSTPWPRSSCAAVDSIRRRRRPRREVKSCGTATEGPRMCTGVGQIETRTGGRRTR